MSADWSRPPWAHRTCSTSWPGTTGVLGRRNRRRAQSKARSPWPPKLSRAAGRPGRHDDGSDPGQSRHGDRFLGLARPSPSTSPRASLDCSMSRSTRARRQRPGPERRHAAGRRRSGMPMIGALLGDLLRTMVQQHRRHPGADDRPADGTIQPLGDMPQRDAERGRRP